MRTYDLTVIFKPSVDPTDQKSIDSVLAKALSLTGAKITNVVCDGKKQLSYPIQKSDSGVYVRATLSGDSVKVGDIQKQLKLLPEIIRFLLVVHET